MKTPTLILTALLSISARADQSLAWNCTDPATGNEVLREVIPYVGDMSADFAQRLVIIGESATEKRKINEYVYARYFLGVKDDTTFESKSARLSGKNGVGGAFELSITGIESEEFGATGTGTLRYVKTVGTRKAPKRISTALKNLICVRE
jgi:hypothetical protein